MSRKLSGKGRLTCPGCASPQDSLDNFPATTSQENWRPDLDSNQAREALHSLCVSAPPPGRGAYSMWDLPVAERLMQNFINNNGALRASSSTPPSPAAGPGRSCATRC